MIPYQYGSDTSVTVTDTVTNTNTVYNNKLSKVIEFYNTNINLISSFEFEKLQDYEEMDDDLIIYAMQKAILNNVKKFNYIDAILRSWQSKGFKTLIQAKNEEDEYNKNKNIDALEEFMNEHREI